MPDPCDFPAEILNDALAMELEWGDHSSNPPDARLRKLYPALADDEVRAIFAFCDRVSTFGNKTAYDLVMDPDAEPSSNILRGLLHAEYPWMDDRNVSRLYSNGAYSAARDGVLR